MIRLPFAIPRKYLKVIGISACLFIIVLVLLVTHMFGVFFGIASRELVIRDKEVIATIPRRNSALVFQNIRSQVDKYDKSITQRMVDTSESRIATSIPNLSCVTSHCKIVLVIRIPKCASTSFVTTLKQLSSNGYFHFTFDPSGAYDWDSSTISKVAKRINTESQLGKLNYVYARHFYYFSFVDYNLPEFSYVTIVREPVFRFISSFLYYHFSSKHHIQAILDPRHKNESLETCLDLGHEGCQSNLMTKYFCGHEAFCKKGSMTSFLVAKQNIVKDFKVVGIMENMTLSYRLIKNLLPDHFQHLNPESASKNKQNKNEHAIDISQSLREKIEEKNKFDILLYDFIRERLYRQATACSLL